MSTTSASSVHRRDAEFFSCTVRKRAYIKNNNNALADSSAIRTDSRRDLTSQADQIVCINNSYSRSVKLIGDIDAFFGIDSYTLGATKLSIPESLIVNRAVNLDADGASAIEINHAPSRGTEHQTGTWKVLLIRVTDSNNDGPPSVPLGTMGAKQFDYAVSLRSQFKACSRDQLTFNPATGPGLTNGAIEVTLSTPVSGRDSEIIEEEAVAALGDLSRYDYTFVMIVVSSSVSGVPTAYAYVPGIQSVYNDWYFNSVLTCVHEFGHNLGLHHANYQGIEYEDPTGVMGGADTNGDDFMCFNGPNIYYLGWFSQYHEDLDENAPVFSGDIVPYNDVATGMFMMY